MENQPYAEKMQEEMIREIEAGRPSYMVFVNVPTSWIVRKNSSRRIFEWFDRYSRDGFRLRGVIDIVSAEHTEYRWNGDAQAYRPASPFWCAVFRRVPGPGS
jgi:hypothetical protein